MKFIIFLLLSTSVSIASTEDCVSQFPVARYKLYSIFDDYEAKLGSLKITKDVLQGKKKASLAFSPAALMLGLEGGFLKGDEVALVAMAYIDGICTFSLTNKNEDIEYGAETVFISLEKIKSGQLTFFEDEKAQEDESFRLSKK